MIIHNVPQRTPEWHAIRKQHVTASEMAAIMGESKWAPFTWRQVYEAKTGITQVEVSYPMMRGTELEPRINALFCEYMGHQGDDLVASRDHVLASLDWINLENTIIGEFKAPMKGFDADWVQDMANGNIDALPRQYHWQVQSQLFVSGAAVCHFVVYDDKRDDILVFALHPDQESIDALVAASAKFHKHLVDGTYPPAQAGDVVEIDDVDTIVEVRNLRIMRATLAAKQAELKPLEDEIKAIEKGLQAKAKDHTINCDGMQVQRIIRSGNVDYAKLLKQYDLVAAAESFRKPSTVYWKITDKSGD